LIKKKILIPIYNDWSSLEILLNNLEKKLKSDNYEIVIVDDCSIKKKLILSKSYNKIKKIKILNLTKNMGSQRCIAIGLKYLSQFKENFIITVMDGDGEDNPDHVNDLFAKAEKYSDSVITANRLSRHEGKVFQFLYKAHLLVTFLLTFKWIDFGNFTCFRSLNLEKIQKNNEIGIAVSAAVIKNCKILTSPTKRLSRYKDNSKVSYFGLFLHSLRILSIFYNRVLFTSFAYLTLAAILFVNSINILSILISFNIIFNIFLILVYKNFKITDRYYKKLKISEDNC